MKKEIKKINSVKQEQVHDILFNREIGWQDIIYDLINTEQLNPWEFWLAELGSFAQTLIALPRKAENVLGILESGKLSIRTPGPERELQRINRTLRRGISALLFFAFLTNGVWLYLNQEFLFAGILFAGAVLSLAGAVFARTRHN